MLYSPLQDAHAREVWGLDVHLNPKTKENDILVLSGSADKTLKFWTLTVENVQASAALSKSQRLRLELWKELETTDEVLSVRFTPDGRFFVFSLLDYTMKVCYIDSFKLFLSLYGHKLPVLSFDISSDNMLLASGSADKNIRIWGMDFGDIHKSIFAHQVSHFFL